MIKSYNISLSADGIPKKAHSRKRIFYEISEQEYEIMMMANSKFYKM
jgi:hypothetical protein